MILITCSKHPAYTGSVRPKDSANLLYTSCTTDPSCFACECIYLLRKQAERRAQQGVEVEGKP